MGETTEPAGDPSDVSSDEALLETLPKEVGVLLIVAGIGGVLLPGPIGTPLLVIGGMILFPAWFRNVDRGMRRRFPQTHEAGMKKVRRFARDLDRRYPSRA